MIKTIKRINWQLALLILIIVWGAFLRLYDIGHQSLWIDESYSYIAAERTAEVGAPILESGYNYHRGKPHTYIVAGLYKIFGKQAWALRFPAALFGILTIWLVYYMGVRLLKNRPVALIAAALTAFSYYEIAWSRQIRFYSEHQFFYLLSLILFYFFLNPPDLIKNSKRKDTIQIGLLIVIGLLTIITIMLTELGFFLFPAYLVLGLLHFTKSKKKFKKIGQISIVLVIAIVLIYYFNKPIFGIIEGFIKTISLERSIIFFQHYLLFLLKKYSLVSVGAVIGIIYGIVKKNRMILTIAVIYVGSLIGISLYNSLGMRYIFFLNPLLFLLAAYAIHCLYQPAVPGKKWSERFFYVRIFIIGIILSLSLQNNYTKHFVFLPQNTYFLEYDPTYEEINKWDYSPQADFKKAYELIEKNMVEDDVFIVAHTAIHNFYMPESEFYWLAFPFIGKKVITHYEKVDGKKVERYTAAPIIDSIKDLEEIMQNKHGYILLDHFSMAGHIHQDFKNYISDNSKGVPLQGRAHPDMPGTFLQVVQF